ncbi:MAG TPA: uroporphyrinogen decarboxylase [Phycisphaerae bacterium]|jgi:uroporphyrinogen decarboxylase
MKACRREPTPRPPLWLMRQAGRYLPEYRKLRSEVDFLQMCKRPELAAEVTLMPVRRFSLDAAIIFADILLVAEPLGVGLNFTKGEGPVIYRPVRGTAEIEALESVDVAESLGFVFEAVRVTRAALAPDLPLIGFCGAPFTVASYLVQGCGSKHYERTKLLMYEAPAAWHKLMEKLVRISIDYLNGQIEAGVQAVQIFDSWVGALSPADYRKYVLEHSRTLISSIKSGVPVIHFGTGTAGLLELLREAGGDVIGVDWRIDLGQAWSRLGDGVGIQGNLDPVVLLGGAEEIRRQTHSILKAVNNRPGHIFNLGHGILLQTPVESVAALVDAVHEHAGHV